MSVITPSEPFWDALDAVATQNRICPACGETDIKFALHSRSPLGIDVSVGCNDCGRVDTCTMAEVKEMVDRWHRPVSPQEAPK